MGEPRPVDNNELAIAVASRSTLPILVVKSALTAMSPAVGDARTSEGELTVPSSGILLTEGNEADAVNKDVGITESRSAAVAPTLIPVGTGST